MSSDKDTAYSSSDVSRAILTAMEDQLAAAVAAGNEQSALEIGIISAALEQAVAVHRDTSLAWQKRAEKAEAFHASLQVHVDSLRADLRAVGAENGEFRERWAKKAHELHLAKQRIAELEIQLERLQSVAVITAAELKLLTSKMKPEPPAARAAQDAAIGRISRGR